MTKNLIPRRPSVAATPTEAAPANVSIVVAPSPPIQRRAATTTGRTRRGEDTKPPLSAGPWLSIQEAAWFLGTTPITLRRAIERSARRRDDGTVTAQLDGITARKLGRAWRVWLDATWRGPSGPTDIEQGKRAPARLGSGS